ncbi:MAG: stage III sporulation protein AB [Oscillospiraceae bacterium]|nr:stage III sporulation protein AB [Candidatus Ruminococcus equi]
MIKLLGCVLLVFCSTILGNRFSRKLSKRKEILQNFVNLLDNAYTKIEYSSNNLADIFNDSFLEFSFKDNEPFSSQWKTMLKGYQNILSSNDINLLIDFSNEIGKTDTNGEISNILLYQGLLKENIESAKDDIEKKSRLYTLLGFSIGMTLAIILI